MLPAWFRRLRFLFVLLVLPLLLACGKQEAKPSLSDNSASVAQEGAGNGEIIDGDGNASAALHNALVTVQAAFRDAVDNSTVDDLASLDDCRGYSKTACDTQSALSLAQRREGARLGLAIAQAVLPIFTQIKLVMTTEVWATDANGTPIMVDARNDPNEAHTLDFRYAMVHESIGDAIASDSLELVVAHELGHQYYLPGTHTRLGDFMPWSSFSSEDEGRQAINAGMRAILAFYQKRQATPPLCTLSAPQLSLTVPAEYDGKPQSASVTSTFSMVLSADHYTHITRLTVEGGSVRFDEALGQGTATLPTSATPAITAEVKSDRTGLSGTCSLAYTLTVQAPKRNTVYQLHLSGPGTLIFSYQNIPDIPSAGWILDGPTFQLLSAATPRCSLGFYSDTYQPGGARVNTSGGAALGFGCKDPVPGATAVVEMESATGSVTTADLNYRDLLLAKGFVQKAILGYVFR